MTTKNCKDDVLQLRLIINIHKNSRWQKNYNKIYDTFCPQCHLMWRVLEGQAQVYNHKKIGDFILAY